VTAPHPAYARLETLRPKLLPWQPEACEKLIGSLLRHGSALDSSDTGVGKTAHAIAIGHALGRPLAIVCSKWSKPQWKYMAWMLGNTNIVGVHHWEEVRLGKTSFGNWVVMAQKENFQWKLPPHSIVVFDEIHKAGGFKTQNSWLVVSAKRSGHSVLGLSATVADTPLRMFALSYVLGLVPTVRAYWPWLMSNGCQRNQWNGMEFRDPSGRYTARIHDMIFKAGRGVRVKKDEIPGFPDILIDVETMDCSDATDDIAKAYKEIEEALGEYTAKIISAKNAAEIVIRMRQKIELLKIPATVGLVEDIEDDGGAVVVFVNYRETAERLSKALKCGLMIGGMKEADYHKHVQDFQDQATHRLVATYGAGSESINLQDLTGHRPRTELLFPTHSSRQIRQAQGRIHRAGGKSLANVRFVFAAETIEESLMRSIRDKLMRLDTLQDGVALPMPLPPEIE
jgi:superfamily II DNA or RNA helicase